jgi:Zn-dependent peptidase ImmA (M78 family)
MRPSGFATRLPSFHYPIPIRKSKQKLRNFSLGMACCVIPFPSRISPDNLAQSSLSSPSKETCPECFYREGERVVIGVNSVHAKTRQRFSIAHEIGHLLLHKGRPMFIDRDGRLNRRDEVSTFGTDVEEIEANSFAAALLMPRHLLAEAVSRLHNNSQAVSPEVLAKRFDVSVQAMQYRLINLGLIAPD